MNKEILLYALLFFDVFILFLLALFYMKFRKFLSLPWEEIEESLDKAQRLVERLKELKEKDVKAEINPSDPKDEVIYLFQRGLKIKEISKKTGLSEGEIELILKTQRQKL